MTYSSPTAYTQKLSEFAQSSVEENRYSNLSPVQWQQALGMARQLCAEVFQEGGTPEDAVRTFGFPRPGQNAAHWGQAINLIAYTLCERSGSRIH